MQSNDVEASIVIPTHNGGEELRQCLHMVFRQVVPVRFEVIVIDSASTDGTIDHLRRYPVRLQQIRADEFNHGLTRGKGIGLAQGKYVVLMSQDAVPAGEYWLRDMLLNFDDPAVAGVYCRQIPREHADVLTKRNLNRWFTGRLTRSVNFIDARNAYDDLPAVEKLALCTLDDVCSCIRKSAWQRIPHTATYFGEDIEWGKKAIEAGYKIVYEPRAAVVHSHDRSVVYEFKRAYLWQRKTYELFRLDTVPTLRAAILKVLYNIFIDSLYVMREEANWRRRLWLMIRVPLLSLSSVVGRYMGGRDERCGRPLRSFSGV